MIELLGCSLIILLLYLLAYCIYNMLNILKEQSAAKAEARRAASRPRIYKEVHDKWEIERARRELFNTLNKEK